MTAPRKSLGQHWLKDRQILASIADSANIGADDTILEIGPGLGTLTSELLRRAKKVVAVELDQDLAAKLPGQFPGKNLEVINQDILHYDLSVLPARYVVVANVPYYITAKIVQYLMNASNKPRIVVLLVQKEVAERLAATPGDMSILAVSAQLHAEVSLGILVPAALFTPPPQVDSQVVVFTMRPQSLLENINEKLFFRLVHAGFSAKRKKLRTAMAGGLGMPKDQIEALLRTAAINPDDRAESLSVDDWLRLAHVFSKSQYLIQ